MARMVLIKDELRNITTLNLIANTSSILEKIFWALIAICGTLFIYDVVYIQLQNWQENPSLATKEIQHLSNMPIPSFTFCHKGFQKFGPVENLANFIKPEKGVPKEVLSIRNEFLKVQFLKIKHRIDKGSNYCEWLFNLKTDDKLYHQVLKYTHDDGLRGVDRKILLKKCLDFGKNIRKLSINTGKSIALIKNNIYRDIVDGEWWNINQYFKQFHQMILGNNTDMENRLRRGEDILIIGGNEESLSPLLLHVYDKEIEFDVCRNEAYKKREKFYSGHLGKDLVICGGVDIMMFISDVDCQIFDDKGVLENFEFETLGRIFGSFVKLNDSAVWITGGFNENFENMMTTIIVTTNGSKTDVQLPISFDSHCMVHYKKNSIMIIGGIQNGIANSKKTWIINTNNRSNLIEGPSLNRGRQFFSCNKVEDRFGNTLILVIGGEYEDTVEFLNTTEMLKWTFGPKLPYNLSNSGMTITKETKRILLLGGNILSKEAFNGMLELVNDLSEWKEVGFPALTHFRQNHLALDVTSSGKMNFCDKESLDELQHLYLIGNDYLLQDFGYDLTLYDKIFKYLLEPERIGSFLHYAVYDALQSGLHQNVISMTSSLRKMMTTDKGDFDLNMITILFAINDFMNIELLEDYELKNSQVSLIKDCYNALKREQSVKEFESFDEKKSEESYIIPSPCMNLTENSPCISYCEWHKNVVENWSRTELTVIERLASPQPNLIHTSISNQKQTAQKLFGEDLVTNLTSMIAGNNLAFFCKDSKRKHFLGDSIQGIDIAFCNRSKVIQTDVGTCIATDPTQYFENGKILASDDTNYNGEGLKDIEHVMVLLVDKIGLVNNPPNYKTMMPRTNHHDFKVQMQIHEQKGFPKILYGLNQDLDQRSITLKPGHEYKIELYPYGQVTTKDFKELSQDRRGCRLKHETLPNATHPIYTRDNCIYDCLVHKAFRKCKCVPWDFANHIYGAEECDIFGRTCFYNMIERLTHIQIKSCLHCTPECDWIRYRRKVAQVRSLDFARNKTETNTGFNSLCNHYICISPEWYKECRGSSTLCDFLKGNEALIPFLMEEIILPPDYNSEGKLINGTFFKTSQAILDNMIIVRFHYKSSEVEMTKLEVRTTTTDKIANFGGTFGIWAELTGCSLLGLINLLIICFKLLFQSQE